MPDETGLFSIDAIGVKYEWRGGNWKLGPQTGTLTLAGCCAEPPLYALLRGRTREFLPLRSGPPQNYAAVLSGIKTSGGIGFRTQ